MWKLLQKIIPDEAVDAKFSSESMLGGTLDMTRV